MRNGIAFVIAAGIFAALQSAALTQDRPAAKPAVPAPKIYSSPNAVFDAYREAVAKNDARTEMFCQVPEVRGDAYQSYTCSGMIADNPRLPAVFKKYGADAIWPEYLKQYKAKHGIDLEKAVVDYSAKVTKAIADYRKAHPKDEPDSPGELAATNQITPPPTNPDEKLLRKIVDEKITDPIGFMVAMEVAARSPDDEPNRLGPLQGLCIMGNTAVGKTTEEVHSCEYDADGKPTKKVTTRVPRTINFRKTRDGWLIDYPPNDDTAIPPTLGSGPAAIPPLVPAPPPRP